MSNYTVYGKSGTSDWQNEGAQYGIPAGTAKDEWSLGYTNKYTIACWSGYTTEYIQQGYYITIYDLNVATAFHISHYMLDYMQKYATYSAIERPSGISDYKNGYIKDEFKSKVIQLLKAQTHKKHVLPMVVNGMKKLELVRKLAMKKKKHVLPMAELGMELLVKRRYRNQRCRNNMCK